MLCRLPNQITILVFALTILHPFFFTNAVFYTQHSLTSTNKHQDSFVESQCNADIDRSLFLDLEKLSRLGDIAYCVGTTGISHPFTCLSRCNEFPKIELITTFHTGSLMSGNCGYVAIDHDTGMNGRRILVVFRGTYSISDTIRDLSTGSREYIPYKPPEPDIYHLQSHSPTQNHLLNPILKVSQFWKGFQQGREKTYVKCLNCTVHTGFWNSYQSIRSSILPQLQILYHKYPNYQLHFVGHSLGGAIATLAALELDALGRSPHVTTFGEPRVGNAGFAKYIDTVFELSLNTDKEANSLPVSSGRFRRVTHANDPVPLLPLEEWGYRPHSGEIFISKPGLQPDENDLRLCVGNQDTRCIAGTDTAALRFNLDETPLTTIDFSRLTWNGERYQLNYNSHDKIKQGNFWNPFLSPRLRFWQLVLAHRDYFWRLGMCIPGGDPTNWGRDKYSKN
ncbi:extracellular triacylglycerol lipase/putative extracellular lipase [Blumeria hordei DH14]|uniref:Extracellular triacylglycerol lipase/putative extracellular lipase n=1 Tax=Blumeria graminis f. sp. hordei (strain DH14) TaxID=546991 RepID=N1JB50_BLUG1|nr:extracellular triacylglycerol lipase/putative extracellular lipase [Blumeria hordei DH14]